MSIATLMQQMSDAGAPMEAILIAVRAIEEVQSQVEARRAGERERKRRQRAAKSDEDGTVTGQSRDIAGTVTDVTPSPSFPPNPPNTPTPVGNNTRTRKGARLEANFTVPDEWIGWAMKERAWSRDDANAEAANFVDYWHAKPGKDGLKLDWEATWRNWARNSRRPASIRSVGGTAQPTLAQQILARKAAGGG